MMKQNDENEEKMELLVNRLAGLGLLDFDEVQNFYGTDNEEDFDPDLGSPEQLDQPQRAKTLAKLSAAAYWDFSKVQHAWGSYNPRKFESDDIYAFALYRDKVLYISFRGSANLKNWIRDIKLVQVQGKPLTNNKVHTGFLSGYNSVRDAIRKYVSEEIHSDAKVYITGHSLGGALAHLCAFDLAKNTSGIPCKVDEVVTFGQPRVGNRAFSFESDRVLGKGNHIRYVNALRLMFIKHHDPVPSLPPAISGIYLYRHAGTQKNIWSPLTKRNATSDEMNEADVEELNTLLAMSDEELIKQYPLRRGILDPISLLAHTIGKYKVSLRHTNEDLS